MSQVRKLQNGGNSTKTDDKEKHQYGHLIINGKDLGNSEDLYNAFSSYLATAPYEFSAVTSSAQKQMRDGKDVILDLDNSSNIDFPNIKKKSGYSTFRRGVSNAFGGQLDANLRGLEWMRKFQYTPSSASSSKTTISGDKIILDFNKNADGSYTLSDNAKETIAAMQRVSDIHGHYKSGDEATTELKGYDTNSLAAQKKFYNDWVAAGEPDINDYIKNKFPITLTADEYTNVENDPRFDWLKAYNIYANNIGSSGSGSTSGSGNNSGDEAKTAGSGYKTNGAWSTWTVPSGNDKGTYTSMKFEDTSKPYLIMPEDRINFSGLDESYDFAMIDPTTGKIYRQNEYTPQYAQIASNILGINNSANQFNSLKEQYDAIGNLVQWARPFDDYMIWNKENAVVDTPSIWLNEYLHNQYGGNGKFLVSDVSPMYGTKGLYELYDLSERGNQERLGFRNPKYIQRGTDFAFAPIEDIHNSGLTYTPAIARAITQSSPKEIQIKGKNGKTTNIFEVANTNGRLGWGYEGNKIVLYLKDNNGNNYTRVPTNSIGDAFQFIQILQNNPNYTGGFLDQLPKIISWQPVKHQTGGTLRVAPKTVANNLAVTNPTQTITWDSANDPLKEWTSADIQSVASAALDLGGAIAALVPGGGVASATSGLAATGLFLNSEAERKGGWSNLSAGDWGNAILGTALDAVSLVPFIGAGAKTVKAARTISRVAKPLGAAFNALGLKQAYDVISSGKSIKDWTADDLRAVLYGTQAVLNISNRTITARQDSKLAAHISKEKPTDRVLKVGDKDVVITENDIKNLTTKESFEKLLKQKAGSELKEDFDFEKAAKDIDLKYDTSRKYWVVGKKETKVSDIRPKEKPIDEHDYRKLNLFGKRTERRLEAIDEFVKEHHNDLHKKFGSDTPEGKSLARSLQRLGLPGHSGGAYPRLVDTEKNTSTPKPVKEEVSTPKFEKEEASIASPEHKRLSYKAPSAETISGKTDKKTAEKLFLEGKGNDSNLGIHSMSNKAIALAIHRKNMTPEAVENLLSNLSEGRRKAILSMVQNPEGIRRETLKATTTPISRKTIEKSSISKPRAERTAARKAEAISKLKSSKNPMKTLQELSKEDDFKNLANTNAAEFRAALDDAISSYINEKGYKTHQSKILKRDIRGYMNNNGLRFKKGGKIIKAEKGNTVVDWSNLIPTTYNTILRGGQFFTTLAGQNAVARSQHRATDASVWKPLSQTFTEMSTATPVEDRQIEEIEGIVKRGQTTPKTSDAVVNNSAALGLQGQALTALAKAIDQQSAARRQIEAYNANAIDKTNASSIAAENDYRARQASAGYQHGMIDASKRTQLFQSLANWLYESRAKFDQDEQLLNRARLSELMAQNKKNFDNDWSNYIRGNADLNALYNTWSNLDSNTRGEFEDYVSSQGKWTPAIQRAYSDLMDKYRLANANIQTKLYMNPTTLWLHGVRPQYKKGGRLNGKTRYTLEPDERVWIEQNKAAHRAASQFNDSVIKAFLKTIK